MTAQASYFRKHARAQPSSWRLLPWVALGLFDLALWAYIVVTLLWGRR